jgi:hypothetical protein
MLLLQCRDPEVFRLLPDLFDHPQLGRMAVRYCRPSDPLTAERLHGLLGPARGRHWSEAALALARAKVPSVRPLLLGWLGSGDTGEFNVAVEGLALLDSDGGLELFQRAWDAGGGAEERRLILAAALLRLRDARGVGLLEEVARRADGPWAVFAAFGLASYDPPRAYSLMLDILDDGGLEAKRALVMQVWNFCEAPHAFTADGLHEARVWVERQIQQDKVKDSGPTQAACKGARGPAHAKS